MKPLSVDLSNPSAMRKALRGVGSVVIVGKLGAVSEALTGSGVRHVVLLSSVGEAFPILGVAHSIVLEILHFIFKHLPSISNIFQGFKLQEVSLALCSKARRLPS